MLEVLDFPQVPIIVQPKAVLNAIGWLLGPRRTLIVKYFEWKYCESEVKDGERKRVNIGQLE